MEEKKGGRFGLSRSPVRVRGGLAVVPAVMSARNRVHVPGRRLRSFVLRVGWGDRPVELTLAG
jgi:hypothetical protein